MDAFAIAAEYRRNHPIPEPDREEHLNILEDERRLAEMNGESVPPEPLPGDLDCTGQFVYTKVGTTSWGTPVMRWRRWGF